MLVEISHLILLLHIHVWRDHGGGREAASWTADPGGEAVVLLQLQTTDKAGADQGANQGRYWLPHCLEQLEERRAGREGKTVPGP